MSLANTDLAKATHHRRHRVQGERRAFSVLSAPSVVILLLRFDQNSSFNANWISLGSRALETWPKVGPSVIFPSGT